MKNEKDIQKEVTLGLINKISDNELNKALSLHEQSANMNSYVKIPFLIIGIGFAIHNIFLAGKTFSYDAYNNIQTIEMSVVGICVFTVVVIAARAMSANSKLKKMLFSFSEKHTIDTKTLEGEFDALANHLHGARM